MQALARDQVRRYSEGHGFGKASGPHTIYLTLTLIALIALTWSEPPCDLIESWKKTKKRKTLCKKQSLRSGKNSSDIFLISVHDT